MANTAIRPVRRKPVRRKAGNLRFPGPLPAGAPGVLAAASALLAAVLAVGGVRPARAQDAPGGEAVPLVSIDRLKFEYKCYFNIPEWRGRGEETFLKRLAEQKGVYKAKLASELPSLEGLMAQGYWEQKTTFEGLGRVDDADGMAERILVLESTGDRVVRDFQDKADAFVTARNFAKAKKLEGENKLAEARQKYATVANAKDQGIGQQAVSALALIVRRQRNYQPVVDSNDLAEIGAMLDAVIGDLRTDLGPNYEKFLKGSGGKAVNADLKGVEDEKTRIAGSTQVFQVSVRDVSKALDGVVQGRIDDTSAATFRLEPEGEGKPFPPKGASAAFKKNPFTWHRGVYTVRAFAPGSDRPFATLHGLVLKDAPGAVEIPGRVPAGMVWVPGPKPGGAALFVDRYEVTVAQVEAVKGSDKTLEGVVDDSTKENATADTPAWFAEEAAALAYARAAGKSIPTVEQWLLAAYGGQPASALPYPWGKDSPDSTRAFASKGAGKPEAAGGRPAGAAPCGAEDMAGNLAEWVLKDGQLWLLGGYYALDPEGLQQFEGKFPLRDPMPGPAVYDSWAGTEKQNQYLKYRYKGDTLYGSGLRTVIPVPAAK